MGGTKSLIGLLEFGIELLTFFVSDSLQRVPKTMPKKSISPICLLAINLAAQSDGLLIFKEYIYK